MITNQKHKNEIVLGMSGGVDSSVCAYILQKNNYDVICLFMQNWDQYVNSDFLGHIKDNKETCNAQKDFADAQQVANKLNIPIYKTEFIQKYWEKVFKYVIKEYKSGNTPNPDILCNKYIKFDEFIEYAKTKFNCDKIAMGHYANVKCIKGEYFLTKAKDKDKDQTYFLCWLNQEQLSKVFFPIGNLKKSKVRQIAKEQNLLNWNKKDSTGICFIGERKFHDFLLNYISQKPGNIIDIETNKVLGKHDGIMFFTIGQSKNLGLNGFEYRYFVCKKDIGKNILYVVSEKSKNKYLTSNYCELDSFNWINDYHKWLHKPIKVRFRHRMKLVHTKFKIENDKVILRYKKTLGVTKGQFAVLYCGKYCLGGGIINKIDKK